MSIEDRNFYIAAGESLRQCEAWYASYSAGREAALAWQNELGAEEASYDMRTGVNGMKFPGKSPKGWVKCRRPGWDGWSYIGDGPSSRELRKRAESIRPRGYPGESYIGGNMWYEPVVGKLGGKWVISQHKDCKTSPPDAIPIKRSEYMAMVEAEEESKAAVA